MPEAIELVNAMGVEGHVADERNIRDLVDRSRLVETPDRETLRPHDEDAVGTEERNVITESLMEANRTLEQRGAKAQLHHDQQHCKGDAGQRYQQPQRLVPQLQPTKRYFANGLKHVRSGLEYDVDLEIG